METLQQKEQDLRSAMIQEIRSINKYLKIDYLSNLKTETLIALSHPLYREYYKYKLSKISEAEEGQL